MELEQEIGEQPQEISATANDLANPERAEKVPSGSLGKFKDAESLLSAYNNLQAEFTRKCQALSQLQKEDADNEQSSPAYLKEDWNEKVYEFLEKNQEAKPFAKEISQTILNDESISKSDDPLSLAWSKIAMKNYKPPQMAIEDDDFISNVVLKSTKVKDAVLKHFTQQVQNITPPNFINSSSGGNIGSMKMHTPSNLTEAKEMARRFFD